MNWLLVQLVLNGSTPVIPPMRHTGVTFHASYASCMRGIEQQMREAKLNPNVSIVSYACVRRDVMKRYTGEK